MISLVTTVLNDRDGCARFFEQMAAQIRLPNEIVIVDGGSRDGTWEWLQHAALDGVTIKTIRSPGANVASGRNLAIAAASHDLIVSTDVGCSWEPRWLEELAAPLLADADCEAVMGSWRVRLEDLDSDWAKIELAVAGGAMEMLATPTAHASSRAIAYRRDLWRRIGGYPEDLTLAGDDMVFALLLQRTAKRVAAAPTPRCYWERPATLKLFGKEARRNFKGAGEAGIWLKQGVLVGGRLAAELILPVAGLALAANRRTRATGVALFLAGALSVGLRKARLLPAARRAKQSGVRQAFLRTIVFEYFTKFLGIAGYWEGLFRGARQARECRARLRNAGVTRL